MQSIAIIAAFLASVTTPAPVLDAAGDDLWEPASFRQLTASAADPDPFDLARRHPSVLPTTLAEPSKADPTPHFALGASGGYLNVRGADRGTWFGGVQARLRLAGFLAAEASLTFHENHYEDNDIIVTQYPLQLTAMLYIIPAGPIQPYILGGVGWYYTHIDYRDALSALDDQDDHFFGIHLGAGVELFLGPSVSLNADVRYIFVNATDEQVLNRDFNYWQIAFGLNFYF